MTYQASHKKLPRYIAAFGAGGLFGAGLFVSRMVDPAKVQGWLDVFGQWDPTLAFVLGGAVLPMILVWRIAAGRSHAVLGNELPPPPRQSIDRRLVLGSALFGIGWGLAGLCPGPAMASLGFGGSAIWVFVAAMLAGMVLWPRLRRAF